MTTRHKVTPKEMGRIVAQMLGDPDNPTSYKRLPRLTEAQAQFLQAHYEVVQEPLREVVQSPPPVIAALRPFMLKKPEPPPFFIDGDESKKH